VVEQRGHLIVTFPFLLKEELQGAAVDDSIDGMSLRDFLNGVLKQKAVKLCSSRILRAALCKGERARWLEQKVALLAFLRILSSAEHAEQCWKILFKE